MSSEGTLLSSSPFRRDALEGKCVLITGGGTGIGFGIATCMGLHGAKVAIASRRQSVIDEACGKLRRMGVKHVFGSTLDVRNAQSCEKLVADTVRAFGGLDVLVNNAAGNFMVSAENLTENGFRTVLDIDLQGSFRMAKASLGALKASKGLIVNITATLQYKAMPFQLHASAAKAGIDTMTNVLGTEWGADYGIRVVGIAPGPIDGTVGGPNGRVFGGMKGEGKELSATKTFIPLGRFGSVHDIGMTAVFLSTNAGAYINSTTIVVDGGHWHGSSAMYASMKRVIKSKSRKEKATHQSAKL